MRRTPGGMSIVLVLVIVAVIEYYSYVAFRSLTGGHSYSRWLSVLYIFISIFALVGLIMSPSLGIEKWNTASRNTFLIVIFGVIVGKLMTAIIMLFSDIIGLLIATIQFFIKGAAAESSNGEFYSRSEFIMNLAALTGIFSSIAIASGARNKYNYRIKKVTVDMGGVPEALKKLKIVQISDVHSGSFDSETQVQKGIDMINELEPDLILFTGDLVNSQSNEILPYMGIFRQLKAKYGVYSTLGNHDYGDYHQWPSEEAKALDFEKFVGYHADLGWRLLRNEHVEIDIDGALLSVIGVENWSASHRFPKYGNLAQAYQGTDPNSTKILLSHDPSHWDAQVHEYPDIALTLSGHTHGMQFGVEIPGFIKWSPVQYIYKQWAGLYRKGNQNLYVNRGFGFLGYPGRVGILPEITLINLV